MLNNTTAFVYAILVIALGLFCVFHDIKEKRYKNAVIIFWLVFLFLPQLAIYICDLSTTAREKGEAWGWVYVILYTGVCPFLVVVSSIIYFIGRKRNIKNKIFKFGSIAAIFFNLIPPIILWAIIYVRSF